VPLLARTSHSPGADQNVATSLCVGSQHLAAQEGQNS